MCVGDNACRCGVAPSSFPDIAAVEFTGILVRVVPVGVEGAVHSVDVDGPKNFVFGLVVARWCVREAGRGPRNAGEVFLEVISTGRSKC